jgi:hypothetical protein
LQFVEEKKLQVVARRRETEIRNAQRKRELIPRTLVVRQASFLVISLCQRLLALSAQHARELLNISDVVKAPLSRCEVSTPAEFCRYPKKGSILRGPFA